MDSTVAITGAHGFLGSAIRSTLDAEHHVTSLGRHPGDEPWQLSDNLPPDLDGTLALIHGAWAVAPRTSAVANMNIAGSLSLLDEARRHGIPFVFISSMSASDTTRSRYGRAKRAVERHVLTYEKGIVVRPGTIRDEAGGLGMLGASLGRLASLPVDAQVDPDPLVPLVSLERVVEESLKPVVAPADTPREIVLVDEWTPLSRLIASLAPDGTTKRVIRLPQALITTASTVAQYASVPPFRDLADSWLGLIDAAHAHRTD